MLFRSYVAIGHNDRIAWGLTATEGDLQDAVLERLSTESADSYDTPDGPRAFEQRTGLRAAVSDDELRGVYRFSLADA